MIKILLALILLGFAFAVVGFFLYLEKRAERKLAERAKAALAINPPNPDAGWLYSQGLSPDQIELAVRARGSIQ